MASGHLEGTTVLARQATGMGQRRADLIFTLLHPPILGGSDQKVGLGRLTCLKEREPICPAITNMDPHASRKFGMSHNFLT